VLSADGQALAVGELLSAWVVPPDRWCEEVLRPRAMEALSSLALLFLKKLNK
jgi:hypothetical protein